MTAEQIKELQEKLSKLQEFEHKLLNFLREWEELLEHVQDIDESESLLESF